MKKIFLSLSTLAAASPAFAAAETGFSTLKLGMLIAFNFITVGLIMFGLLVICGTLLRRFLPRRQRPDQANREIKRTPRPARMTHGAPAQDSTLGQNRQRA